LAPEYVDVADDDRDDVTVDEREEPMGKVKLSRKAVIREEKGLPVEEYVPPQRSRGFGDRGGRGGDRGGRGGPRR